MCKGRNPQCDEYETPFKKATDANNAGADYFVSIHRNSSERPNQYNGVETLVYNDSGIKAVLARNINEELEKAKKAAKRVLKTEPDEEQEQDTQENPEE